MHRTAVALLLSPLLQPFIGASRIDFGEMSVIDGTPTRGAMASVSVHIVASPLAATRHPSGIPKDTTELPEYTFAVRLQQDRRTKTWLVVDVIDGCGRGHGGDAVRDAEELVDLRRPERRGELRDELAEVVLEAALALLDDLGRHGEEHEGRRQRRQVRREIGRAAHQYVLAIAN